MLLSSNKEIKKALNDGKVNDNIYNKLYDYNNSIKSNIMTKDECINRLRKCILITYSELNIICKSNIFYNDLIYLTNYIQKDCKNNNYEFYVLPWYKPN